MNNTYTCPLQAFRYLTLKLFIQGHPQNAKVPHVRDFKVPISPLLLVKRGLQYETIWAWAPLLRSNDGSLALVSRVSDSRRPSVIDRILQQNPEF